jgi:hypothetical protein
VGPGVEGNGSGMGIVALAATDVADLRAARMQMALSPC